MNDFIPRYCVTSNEFCSMLIMQFYKTQMFNTCPKRVSVIAFMIKVWIYVWSDLEKKYLFKESEKAFFLHGLLNFTEISLHGFNRLIKRCFDNNS